MRWRGQRQSSNMEDRRGMSGGRKVAVGGGIGAIVLLVLSLVTGVDLTQFSGLIDGATSSSQSVELTAQEKANRSDATSYDLVSTVLASTEDVWTDLFAKSGQRYSAPILVTFDDYTATGCGTGNATMGPFYCPADHKAYIDLTFCDDLRVKYKAPGDLAVAYVIAHEVGHHIQNLLGRTSWMQQQRGRIGEVAYNQLSVKLELQADFYAGIWAHYSQKELKWFDPSDIADALRAASAIGDDKLQMEAQGYTVPESFTHGTSQQRMHWFNLGYQSGNLSLGEYEVIK